MPIYTWTMQEGTLSDEQKQALAAEVANIHAEATSAPRSFVRVFFTTYPKGSGFIADEALPSVALICQIRGGRDLQTKQTIMQKCNDAALAIGGIKSDLLAIVLQDIPTGHGMEFGAVLPAPDPAEEARWLEARGR